MLDVLCLAAHCLQLWADLPRVLAHHACSLCPMGGTAIPLVALISQYHDLWQIFCLRLD